jgi:hypothetical protein
MKEALMHILFLGAVVFAASYLKKDTKATTTESATEEQTHRIIVIDSNFQRNDSVAPALALVRDTVKFLHLK